MSIKHYSISRYTQHTPRRKQTLFYGTANRVDPIRAKKWLKCSRMGLYSIYQLQGTPSQTPIYANPMGIYSYSLVEYRLEVKADGLDIQIGEFSQFSTGNEGGVINGTIDRHIVSLLYIASVSIYSSFYVFVLYAVDVSTSASTGDGLLLLVCIRGDTFFIPSIFLYLTSICEDSDKNARLRFKAGFVSEVYNGRQRS